MPSDPKPRRWPHPISGLPAIALAVFVLLYLADRPAYFAILNAIHVHAFPHPFLDTRFVTAQVECWSRGIDVYAHNPCDPLGRTFDYSPLWLRLPFLARSDAWTPILGLGVDLVFVTACLSMPWRPAGAFDVVVMVAAILSWASLFGMERGNSDLLMFAAGVVFARLWVRAQAARTAGYGLVLGVGLLKFYPLVLLALMVREPARRLWATLGLCGLVLAVFFATYRAELARIGANMADGLFGDQFGARSLPFGLLVLAQHTAIRNPSGNPVGIGALDPGTRPLGWILLALMTAGCVIVAIRGGRTPAMRSMLDRIDPATRALLLVGSVLCAGCFFAHQNIGYRALLLLLVLPGLLALARVAPGAPARVIFRATTLLVLVALWDGVIGRQLAGWVVMQAAWWWIVLVLLAIVVSLLGSEAARLPGPIGRRAAMLLRAP